MASDLQALLRAHARRALQVGRLPIGGVPGHTWGGPGHGQPCALCHRAVTDTDVEFDVIESQAADDYHFHVRCFMAWDAERRDMPRNAVSSRQLRPIAGRAPLPMGAGPR